MLDLSAMDREGDPTFALGQAVQLLKECFCDRAGCTLAGAVDVARQVTAVADVFVAWLRRPVTLRLVLVAIEDVDTGEPVADPLPRGESMAVELKIGQRARYTIEARDARGFLNKEALDLTITNGDDVTAEIVETEDPNTPNELVVTAVEPGLGTVVTLDVPDDETVAPASDSYNVRAGDVATLVLGPPVIEDVPTPEPEPVPVPGL